MISKSTFEFLKNLSKNNNKEWFHSNKKLYNNAKSDFKQLVSDIFFEISKFDDYSTNDPDKNIYIFRINRDVRFSKDKSPYKTNFAALIGRGGRRSGNAFYYIHLEPGNSFFGGGRYELDSKELNKIRAYISENFLKFKDIVENKSLKDFISVTEAEKLVNIPRGFDKNDPAGEFLKLKHYTVTKKISDNYLMKNAAEEDLGKNYKKIFPFIEFLNKINKI